MKITGPQIAYWHKLFGRILGSIEISFNGGFSCFVLPYMEDNGIERRVWSLFSFRIDINSRYCILWFDLAYFKFGGYQLFEPYYKRKFDAEIKEFTKNWPDDDIPF